MAETVFNGFLAPLSVLLTAEETTSIVLDVSDLRSGLADYVAQNIDDNNRMRVVIDDEVILIAGASVDGDTLTLTIAGDGRAAENPNDSAPAVEHAVGASCANVWTEQGMSKFLGLISKVDAVDDGIETPITGPVGIHALPGGRAELWVEINGDQLIVPLGYLTTSAQPSPFGQAPGSYTVAIITPSVQPDGPQTWMGCSGVLPPRAQYHSFQGTASPGTPVVIGAGDFAIGLVDATLQLPAPDTVGLYIQVNLFASNADGSEYIRVQLDAGMNGEQSINLVGLESRSEYVIQIVGEDLSWDSASNRIISAAGGVFFVGMAVNGGID